MSTRAQSTSTAAPTISKALLYTTAVVSGAAVMVVEVVGTRVLGPVFGVGLFVWAALLTVTLGSLAAGYYLGGAWADRRPTTSLLGTSLGIGALALALAVASAHPLIAITQQLGQRAAPLVCATLLFGPSLVFLGMTGPIAIRLVIADVRLAGHGVGRIYALSTVGSLVSTLAVSFVLIPAFETHVILLSTAAVLALNAAVCLAGRARAVALLILLVSGLVGLTQDPRARALPAGMRIVERAQSPYSLLEVIEDRERGVRVLRADHSIIGGQGLQTHVSIFNYLYVLQTLRWLHPSPRSALQIGLGTGALAMSMQDFGLAVDTVEIDPGVVRMAREHFGYRPTGEVAIEDARAFINRSERTYDLIVHDTFTGGSTPLHLLSLEVVQRLKQMLRPSGILALNFVGFESGEGAQATWSIRRTLRAAFPHVRVFGDSASESGPPSIKNLIFLASEVAIDLSRLASATTRDPRLQRALWQLRYWELRDDPARGQLITDAQNPLGRMQITIAEHHAQAMEKLLPPEVWSP